MKNISIQIDEELFKKFAIACAELGAQKKSIIINFIKHFLEQEEDKNILALARKRLKRFETGNHQTISHKDAWR